MDRPSYAGRRRESGTAGGGGLWLAHYDPTDGITDEQVPYDDAFGSCDEDDFLVWEGQVGIVVDPASDPAGDVRVFLTSRDADCGVVEVVFDGADPTDASSTTWTALDTSTRRPTSTWKPRVAPRWTSSSRRWWHIRM